MPLVGVAAMTEGEFWNVCPLVPVAVADAPLVATAAAPPPQGRLPAASQRPQQTLQTRRDEASELRRAISAPGMPSADLEMDLEEIHELEHTPHGRGAWRQARRRGGRSR